MISYIIPTHMCGERLSECLLSILNQRDNVSQEIILVENAYELPAEISDICKAYPNLRIVSEPKRGAGIARNRGLLEASGEIIAFIDSDVTLAPDWQVEALRLFRYPWVDVVQPSIFPVGSGPMTSVRHSLIAHKTKGTFNYLNLASEGWPQINTASLLVRKSALDQLRFDENLKRCEDTDFGLQLFFSGAHFATAEKARSFVSDNRNFAQYLMRSYRSGLSLGKVKRMWRDPGHGKWIHRLNSVVSTLSFPGILNGLFHLFGEAKEDLHGEPQFDKRSVFFRRQRRNLLNFSPALSPDVRVVCLDSEIVFYNLKSETRWVLKGKEREEWLKTSAGKE